MNWFSRFRNKSEQNKFGDANFNNREAYEYFSDFISTRTGVAGYFESATVHESPALVVVAKDGEWTRRKVKHEDAAKKICEKLEIPFFTVASSGYPRAMREWNIKNSGSTNR